MVCLSIAATAVSGPRARQRKKVGPDCTLKRHKLYGKVKIVTTFPDLKVQVVKAFPDLKVKLVDALPDSCGKWEMTDTSPLNSFAQ